MENTVIQSEARYGPEAADERFRVQKMKAPEKCMFQYPVKNKFQRNCNLFDTDLLQ